MTGAKRTTVLDLFVQQLLNLNYGIILIYFNLMYSKQNTEACVIFLCPPGTADIYSHSWNETNYRIFIRDFIGKYFSFMF
jgi:hypothetical protein